MIYVHYKTEWAGAKIRKYIRARLLMSSFCNKYKNLNKQRSNFKNYHAHTHAKHISIIRYICIYVYIYTRIYTRVFFEAAEKRILSKIFINLCIAWKIICLHYAANQNTLINKHKHKQKYKNKKLKNKRNSCKQN